MSSVNVMAREIAAKVVVYGPGLSGKTTSLKRVYESVKPSLRGELLSLPTEADRTLFFDFLPVRVEKVGDYSLRLALYTVPGQVFYNATRKLVLQGADGVIFVADSNPAAMDSNVESMANLSENLAEQGISLPQFPLAIAYNKRDLPHAVPVEEMRKALNPRGVPDFECCATSGEGVLDVMKAIIRLVIRELKAKKVVPTDKPKPSAPKVIEQASAGLESQIQEHLAMSKGPLPKTSPPRPAPPVAELGPAAALAPSALVDPAKVADACYARGDWDGCVRACQDAVRRALSYAGEGPPGAQSHLLGLDGRDVLALLQRSERTARIDDAAFALYVVMQAFVRLAGAGLPARLD